MSSNQETHYINGYHASVLKTHNQRTAQNSCQFLLPTLDNLSTSKNTLHPPGPIPRTKCSDKSCNKKETPKFKLLDAGCGPGSITTSLAQLYPASRITALDISTSALEPARSTAAAAGVQNISFVAGDVYALPFEPNTFDVVHAQQLLCHLPNAVDAIKELMRVTKPGGIVALREGDAKAIFWYPESEMLEKSWSLFAGEMESKNSTGDAKAGRKLRSWVRAAGVEDAKVKMSAGTWCYSSEAERQAFGEAWMERVVKSDFAVKVVEQGMATQQELQGIRLGWEQWTQDPDGWLCIPHGEALITVT